MFVCYDEAEQMRIFTLEKERYSAANQITLVGEGDSGHPRRFTDIVDRRDSR